MTEFVLDASALLALLRAEPGGDRVGNALADSAMTAVNFAEVVGHYARNGAARANHLRGDPYALASWQTQQPVRRVVPTPRLRALRRSGRSS